MLQQNQKLYTTSLQQQSIKIQNWKSKLITNRRKGLVLPVSEKVGEQA